MMQGTGKYGDGLGTGDGGRGTGLPLLLLFLLSSSPSLRFLRSFAALPRALSVVP